MDFVAKEIFYLFWFSLTLGTFGAITEKYPVNQAVLNGAADVNITCVSNTNANAIKWSFRPVGSKDDKIIKNGDSITDTNTFGGLADGKSYTLTIKSADSSTAGTYTCEENGIYSVLLIVLTSETSCDYSPRPTRTSSCDLPLTLLCTVSYIANTTLATASLAWSTEPETEDLPKPDPILSPPDSGNIATSTSTLVVTWPKEGNIPIYACYATFSLIESTAARKTMDKLPTTSTHKCKPFDSANDVPCIGKDGNLRKYEDPGKSKKNSSPARSAETNNLAIRVLGVAGVLLLAQVL